MSGGRVAGPAGGPTAGRGAAWRACRARGASGVARRPGAGLVPGHAREAFAGGWAAPEGRRAVAVAGAAPPAVAVRGQPGTGILWGLKELQ